MPYFKGISEDCLDGMDKIISALDGCVSKKDEKPSVFEAFLKISNLKSFKGFPLSLLKFYSMS